MHKTTTQRKITLKHSFLTQNLETKQIVLTDKLNLVTQPQKKSIAHTLQQP